MRASSCIFCGIIEGRLPSEKLYEDARTLAFMDIRPLVPGHALVIPKAHCSDLRDCDPADLGPVLETVQRVAPALLAAVGADGYNLIVANGVSAGQEVFHLHAHIMPRRPGDGFTARSLRDSVKSAKIAAHSELRPTAEKVRRALSGAANMAGV